eukprot:6862172-Lingulodinium_polyedra.AAC.1
MPYRMCSAAGSSSVTGLARVFPPWASLAARPRKRSRTRLPPTSNLPFCSPRSLAKHASVS